MFLLLLSVSKYKKSKYGWTKVLSWMTFPGPNIFFHPKLVVKKINDCCKTLDCLIKFILKHLMSKKIFLPNLRHSYQNWLLCCLVILSDFQKNDLSSIISSYNLPLVIIRKYAWFYPCRDITMPKNWIFCDFPLS